MLLALGGQPCPCPQDIAGRRQGWGGASPRAPPLPRAALHCEVPLSSTHQGQGLGRGGGGGPCGSWPRAEHQSPLCLTQLPALLGLRGQRGAVGLARGWGLEDLLIWGELSLGRCWGAERL